VTELIDEHTEPLSRLDGWRADVASLRNEYAAAEPFPHIVLDGALDEAVFAAAVAEFPVLETDGWTGYLHVNEAKFGNTKPETWGCTLQRVAKALTAPPFVSFLEQLTGIDGLLPDRTMDGGGLHQTLAGGHLNVHTDFTAHHTVPGWRRRVNVLLYLNPEWDPAWGGDLELWSADMSEAVTTVAPVGNRLLVFTTDETSLHGHPEPLRCPDGMARRSLALYYFTAEPRVPVRSTTYRARPGDGWRRLTIAADQVALRAYDGVKRRFKLSDDRVSRLLRRGR
jgi:hypothetical protein